jgi:hypothetical protein
MKVKPPAFAAFLAAAAPSSAFVVKSSTSIGIQRSNYRQKPSFVVYVSPSKVDTAGKDPVKDDAVVAEDRNVMMEEDAKGATAARDEVVQGSLLNAAIAEIKAGTSSSEKEFLNEGPFAWMGQYLSLSGLKEGKGIMYGVFPVDVDESQRPTTEETEKLRRKAAEDLINIGPEERKRRDEAGTVMLGLAAVYIAWASLIADDGGLTGHLLRFFAVFPLFLGLGYKLSAATGL